MHLKLKRVRDRRLNQRGDTIIEVMIVLAIVGLAVGISFATANTSLLTVQAAAQNTQATALLQRQIEDLRYLGANPSTSPNPIYQPAGYYCINDAANPPVMSTAFSGALSGYGIYPPVCVMNGTYHLAIAYNATNDTFTVTAYWDNIQGFGQDTATLVYRMHQLP